MLCDLGNLQVKQNKGWDQEDKVVSSSNTIFSKERQKPPKTVILLQIVLVSPETLVTNHEPQLKKQGARLQATVGHRTIVQ